MGSFIQKFKNKGFVELSEQGLAVPQKSRPENVNELPVDVYKSKNEIIICAQIPSTDIQKIDVSIEGDNDVIVIQGEQTRPENLAAIKSETREDEWQENNDDGNIKININNDFEERGIFLFKECVWGHFFRKIVLPQKINPEQCSAKTKDGVLILSLPFRKHSDNKIKLEVVRFDDYHHD